ncbi:hypothetical protein AbraIFM66951_001650 [Aspergillus brasiliensis]|uniref:GCN5-related N-acetyltransferase Rv2170-like domain-containing protein n=1 Tax=Aspergillus brasiliensis TaxID=319629 RepID=A0A9W6DJ38_9EURO|nr:hypothetical protein AbraCBS73388_007233 [Aspergillus brasiliensis]GKZ49246.1 hypothetical protein AbraIFM66951_001650 [Aspergillus brasiliensis]
MSTTVRNCDQGDADPIHETSPHSEWTQTQLLPLLRSHLPHSLPLLRRIQHEIAHPSPTAVILTTFPGPAPPASSSASLPVSPSASGAVPVPELVSDPGPGPIPVPGPRVPDPTRTLAPDTVVPAAASDPESFPWLVAHVDLSAGRETQVILYSSVERTTANPFQEHVSTSTGTSSENTSGSDRDSNTVPITSIPSQHHPLLRTQLLLLLHYIKQHLLPPYLTTLSQSQSPSQTQDHQLPPPPPTAFLFGNLHTGVFSTLLNPTTNTSYSLAQPNSPADFIPGLKVHRFSQPAYVKYLLPREIICHPQDQKEGEKNLPPGFHFSDGCIPRKNLGLVRSRTVIPRSEETLSKLRSCAVYRDDGSEEPVAWAFLGTDGSLATLHVEEEVRGLGLAGYVGREVMRRGIEEDGELDDGWMHSNAAMDNMQSRRVMEKLGGRVGWTVCWCVLEV